MNDELNKYVESKRNQGASDEEIRNTLSAQGGWSQDDLDSVLSVTKQELHTQDSTEYQSQENNPISPVEHSNVQSEKKSKAKLIVGVIISIILLVVGVYFVLKTFEDDKSVNTTFEENVQISSSDNENLIESSHGFSFTPPEGWILWEGASALDDAGRIEEFQVVEGESKKQVSNRYIKIKSYIDDWSPEKSRRFTFTTSKVDTKTRNLNLLAEFRSKRLINPLIYDIIEIFISDTPITYGDDESSDKLSITHREIAGVNGKIEQRVVFEKDSDFVFTIFPVEFSQGSVKKVTFFRYINKSDESITELMDDFIRGFSSIEEIDSDKTVYESAKCGISFELNSSWEVRELPDSVADNTMVVIPRPEPITSSGIVNLYTMHNDLSINELILKHESLGCNGCEFRDPIESNINGIKVIEHFAYDISNKNNMRPGRFYIEQNNQVCSLNDEAAPEELIKILNSIKSI